MDNLAAHIQALLFALGAPLSRAELAEATEAAPSAIEEAIVALKSILGGIVLVDDGTEVELRAAPETAELIERVRKEAYSRSIGRAGLEVLAALLYRGPLSRAEVDFIRGVNSSQTLRSLAARGLVRKIANPKDDALPASRQGSFLYEPTTELLAMLGMVHTSDLPDFTEISKKLTALEASYQAVEPRE